MGWYTIDTGAQAFVAEELVGGYYIFDLDASGTVKQSSGTGWYSIDTGVDSLAATNLGGTNYFFDLNSAGVLKESTARAGTRRTRRPVFATENLIGTNSSST